MVPNRHDLQDPWKVSLHGGHSSEFCDHARSPLRDILEAAVARGYHVFGVTEHAPRVEPRFLYPEEITLGWDVAKLRRDFEAYARLLAVLAREFTERLVVLRGFEAEVIPADGYVDLMLGLRKRLGFEYIVGSVHWLDDEIFDYGKDAYYRVVARYGGLEPFAVRYYEVLAEMVCNLKPEVVGHLDIVRKHADPPDAVETAAVRLAAEKALEAIRAHGCIVDVNSAGLRKGLASPYPAPWLVRRAAAMGIPFCFGDDSHRAADVGVGISEAREYLLQNGVTSITTLTRESGEIARKVVPLW